MIRARLSSIMVMTLALGACASQPKPLQGDFFERPTPHTAVLGDYTGTAVRWGGRIVQLEPRTDTTCFEMIATRLAPNGRPFWAGDDTNGRFIACRVGFYDPAVFQVNREVTFTGHIVAYDTRHVGEHEYRFPRIDIEDVHLWPVREPVDPRRARSPWWGSW